jgi:hypothetical protein
MIKIISLNNIGITDKGLEIYLEAIETIIFKGYFYNNKKKKYS